ncbi:uncharacterized protein BDZ99DRAFT_521586 [Mytilinidion resinicola]|uniref:Uncharacterized protein n=1 Tax=Mytilinidion resinicola TaxID=574789 RepID=A0A6A6YJV0_9PEZI|nr:uncharacterized protein BDZ99DRAFT_521586 [Mytilinidion resinicola]KAF2809132.1 hypothetical protein BDZ99DRAFT_521586 [Mytilinidion resinicola]
MQNVQSNCKERFVYTIALDSPGASLFPLSESASFLQRTLRQNPELGHFCKGLRVFVDCSNCHKWTEQHTTKIMREFTNARKLCVIECDYTTVDHGASRSTIICDVFESMDHLTELSLEQLQWHELLSSMGDRSELWTRLSKFPYLQILELVGFSPGGKVFEGLEGASSITTLKLRKFSG